MVRDTTARAPERFDDAEPSSEEISEHESSAVQKYRAMFESLPPDAKAHFTREMDEYRRPGWRERYDQELEEIKRRGSDKPPRP